MHQNKHQHTAIYVNQFCRKVFGKNCLIVFDHYNKTYTITIEYTQLNRKRIEDFMYNENRMFNCEITSMSFTLDGHNSSINVELQELH